ncbi:MAG: RHS repeat-associated core domain-containing protein [bacterium]
MIKKRIIFIPVILFFCFYIQYSLLLPAFGYFSSKIYRYDNNGNTIIQTNKQAQFSFFSSSSYNSNNRPIKTTSSVQSSIDKNVIFYTYNHIGMRSKKISVEDTKSYVYDYKTVVVEKYWEKGLLNKYDYGNELIRLGVSKEDTTYYYYHDILNSVTDLIRVNGINNEKNELVYTYSYDQSGSFRNVIDLECPFSKFSFTGKEFDKETESFYFWARDYDSKLARFKTQDEQLGNITSAQLNRFIYCYGNPNKYIDPDGNDPVSVAIATGMLLPPVITKLNQEIANTNFGGPGGFGKWFNPLNVHRAWKLYRASKKVLESKGKDYSDLTLLLTAVLFEGGTTIYGDPLLADGALDSFGTSSNDIAVSSIETSIPVTSALPLHIGGNTYSENNDDAQTENDWRDRITDIQEKKIVAIADMKSDPSGGDNDRVYLVMKAENHSNETEAIRLGKLVGETTSLEYRNFLNNNKLPDEHYLPSHKSVTITSCKSVFNTMLTGIDDPDLIKQYSEKMLTPMIARLPLWSPDR